MELTLLSLLYGSHGSSDNVSDCDSDCPYDYQCGGFMKLSVHRVSACEEEEGEDEEVSTVSTTTEC